MPLVLDTRRSARRTMKPVADDSDDPESGEPINLPAMFVEPPIVIDEQTRKRFQDGMIIRLMRVGLSMVDVAQLLNVSEALVRHRIDTMPEGAAKHYASSNALDWLGRA